MMSDDTTRRPQSSPEDIQNALYGGVPMGRWKEGLLFEGIEPTPGLKSAANWFPRTEKIGPDEIRIIFMGTSPMIRPGQMNTSILIQLGNGENFVFDMGEGSVANYIASGIALNEIDKVFITHLHVDHFGSLPYLYMFGGWSGRWHNKLRVFGPSGRTPEYGTAKMVEGMQMMLGWHMDAFNVFPIGEGWNIEVNEFDFRDNGGVIYDEGGVEVIHWQRSHAKDGASGYIASGVQGVPPFLGRYTIDTHHTPGYAAGYLMNQVKPRLGMVTHMAFDPYQNEETVAEIRHHWQGPFHFGAPDGVVVNVTMDKIWVREGILPDFPNSRAPQQNFDDGQLVVPLPVNKREDIQESFVREQEIDPAAYYPEGYKPILLEDWPVDSDLVVDVESLPPSLLVGMGENWRDRKAYDEYIANKENEAAEEASSD
jgi:glyoxylase-like metal-dependent hydrolase (beta-lactamase superfamily II)